MHDRIPCHRAEGLGASVTLHLAVFLTLANAPLSPGGTVRPQLALTYVSADAIASTQSADNAAGTPSISETPAVGPDAAGDIDEFGLELPEFAFDIEKVRAAQEALFPFLSDPLLFLDEARERYRSTPGRLFNPLGRERQTSTFTPLRATDTELQRIVDRAWSRRERWTNFAEIAEMLTTHDPNDGAAYLLMRRYLDQNLLQPYYDSTTRDPRFWVMLGLAADHAHLIEFVGSFVRQHPSSHTTTELLFMLDEFAQASRDTLLMLLSTDPRSDLEDTREASASAHQVAAAIHRRYDSIARDLGLTDTKSIRIYFDDIRLRILKTVIETTPDGYGMADARFLLGLILWDQNQISGALEWWSELEPDGRDAYAATSTEIARELAARDGQTASAISRILGQEYRRWLTFSAERLRQFGYEFDTF